MALIMTFCKQLIESFADLDKLHVELYQVFV